MIPYRRNNALISSPAYQLDEQDMEGYIAGGGEDAWTGFLSTARHVFKSSPVDYSSIVMAWLTHPFAISFDYSEYECLTVVET